jgi:Tol biopolymer transport system component
MPTEPHVHSLPACACPWVWNARAFRVLALGSVLTGCGGSGGGPNPPPNDTDTEPPTVALTSPVPGPVAGVVVIAATATDNESVASVQFMVDGTLAGPADTQAPYSYSWSSSIVSNGNHSLSAFARDAAGNEATSAVITVAVENATLGELQVSVVTTGADADPDGYVVDVGTGPLAIGANQNAVSWDFPPGLRTVTLTGVADNCTIVGYSKVQVLITAGNTTGIVYGVRCSSLTLPGERIAWRATLFGTSGPQLYTMRGDGTGRQPLLDDDWAKDVEWSQDRTKLYYSSLTSEPGVAIYSVNEDGSGSHRITIATNWQYDPSSSPDGQRIAFDVMSTNIWVANANGSNPVRLSEGNQAAWAPSADSILFHKGSAIWIMAANGANAHELIADAEWPHWSPNGSRILFLRPPPVTGGLPAWWVAKADGTGGVMVVELANLENWSASWSPNGRKIVYYDAVGGKANLWTINVDGTGATNLTNSTATEPERHESPSWFR